MSDIKKSSLEKIGYIKLLPKGADINDYETITIKDKDGKSVTLYRCISDKEAIDDTINFSSSWDVFNSLL